jgi:serine/threonine protein kinase
VFETGQVLQERYKLQKNLGRTMASRQTWLAEDLATLQNELVIIKLLVFNSEMQWDDLKLFEREAQVLQNLSHPRIPRYRDYFSLDLHRGAGLCWFGLVQDYIPGTSVQQLLNQGKCFSEAQVRKIATQVLEILIYLHSLNPPVLHRDIKPSNLILTGEDEQIYLVDFGAVQNQAPIEGVSFTIVGTSGYAPLEQFWGRAVPASDLYALGATLIHLLTGVAPAELPQSNLRIQFADRISLNKNFVKWIEKLTEPALEQRFATACEAVEALEHGANFSLEIAPPSDPPQIDCPNATRGIHRVRTCIRVIEKSAEKLEIHKHQEATNFKVCLLLMLSFIGLLILSVGVLLEALLEAFVLAGVLIVSILAFGPLLNNVIRGELHGCFVCFDAGKNHFKFSNQSDFNSSWGAGAISDIRYISIVKFIHSQFCYGSTTTWEVMICTDLRNYILSWGLTEEECIWLVHEIQKWLNSAKLNL